LLAQGGVSETAERSFEADLPPPVLHAMRAPLNDKPLIISGVSIMELRPIAPFLKELSM